MPTKEQIAHDLTMIYMRTRYGVSVSGDFNLCGGSGNGSVKSEHFPDVFEPQYEKVGTGEKGIFGLEKKEKVQSGYVADDLLEEMTETYLHTYHRLYQMLCEREAAETI